jgi:hypothetical protein
MLAQATPAERPVLVPFQEFADAAKDRPYYVLSGLARCIRVASSAKVAFKDLSISPPRGIAS